MRLMTLNADQPITLTRLGYTWLELDHIQDATLAFTAALKPAANPATLQPAALTRAADDDTPATAYAPALVGLAWAALTHDAPEEAQGFARQAVAAEGNPALTQPAALDGTGNEGVRPDASGNAVEAYVTLGLALIRQPGKLGESVAAFEAAQKAAPVAYRYQAHAWLALVDQAQGDVDGALHEAQTATQMEPYSALAHGNAALVYFYAGKTQAAVTEARLATQLNPQSVAGAGCFRPIAPRARRCGCRRR